MADDWGESAIRTLLGLRTGSASPAWGYRAGTSPCVEPTSLASLALLGGPARGGGAGDHAAAVRLAADWLASVQRPDGSLGVSADLPDPGWGTPYALLVWKNLGGYEVPRKRAVAWLLRQAGETMPREAGPNPVLGHDPSIAGWPWVDGTHSWVEPTALAVLALRREGLDDHPRVRDGLRLLRDRAVDTGGWNAGNKATYGRVLRAQPGPTGLALLALAGTEAGPEIAGRAADYLLATLPGVRAAESLGWGLLGLRAWGRAAVGADRWLAESWERVAPRPDAAPRIALLLLAAGERAPELFHAR